MKSQSGAVDTPQTIKAGCGIRYQPESLGTHTQFDFSAAATLLAREQQGDSGGLEPADRTVPNQCDGRDE